MGRTAFSPVSIMESTPSTRSRSLTSLTRSFRSPPTEVGHARERSWYANTNYGIAVLRYDEANRLLRHPQLKQGSNAWPAHHGVTGGPFARWLSSWMLNLEGDDHHRIRRLMNPGFSPRYIQTFMPRFRALAERTGRRLRRARPL